MQHTGYQLATEASVIGHMLPLAYERLNKWQNPNHTHRAASATTSGQRGGLTRVCGARGIGRA